MTDSRMRLNSGDRLSDVWLRGRSSSTAMDGPSVARGPADSGTMRSASRIASSTSLVTSTTVLRSSPCRRAISVCRLAARQRVEGRERLVEQQHLGIERQRASQRDPLPHAARELRRLAIAGVEQADHLEAGLDVRAAPLRRPAAVHLVDREPDVVVGRQPRQQRVVLEDDAALGPGAAHRPGLRTGRGRCPARPGRRAARRASSCRRRSSRRWRRTRPSATWRLTCDSTSTARPPAR